MYKVENSGKWAIGAIIIIAGLVLWQQGSADTLEDLKKAIEERNAEIEKLEQEAFRYQREVAVKQEEAQTLRSEIGRINTVVGQLKRDLAVTRSKIRRTTLEVETLTIEINNRKAAIKKLRTGLAGIIQAVFENDQRPLFTLLINNRFISDFFTQLDYLVLLKERTLASLDSIRTLKEELETKKTAEEAKQKELAGLRASLSGKKAVQESVRNEQDELLRLTNNEEKRYKTLLEQQEEKRTLLEAEIQEIEQKIRITIDPSSLPSKGSGVLGYPLPEVTLESCWQKRTNKLINCITQYFGYTAFAKSGGYGVKKGHNGMDLRAKTATAVSAAENGVVTAVGNTDKGCRGASYGKWILVSHPNNLSTLYTHLSAISVGNGDSVTRGNTIGYSGKSGYATGPHLHFGVFATQAVEITSIRSKVCGRLMTLPIAPANGYLDPLDYL